MTATECPECHRDAARPALVMSEGAPESYDDFVPLSGLSRGERRRLSRFAERRSRVCMNCLWEPVGIDALGKPS